ncbi:kinase-like domain-containing protein [Epithele typhae]|uniref:kinase-like domain-containing protein n=1 Tax=Epithele typhae TaxID=378194 RepID=UPI002007BA92|nr:kinase-like domain-containing protein [Epithele typhae]KAH9913562.1 kinase-like domain-containing protein [Epithele typhae]
MSETMVPSPSPSIQSSSTMEVLQALRSQLPPDLSEWRLDARNEVWYPLIDFFGSRGYTFWGGDPADCTTTLPKVYGAANTSGYGLVPALECLPHEILEYFNIGTGVLQAARMADGRDVVIRVVRMGAVGEMHLRILTVLGRGRWATVSRNHALPLYDTMDLGDITFAVFPKAGPQMSYALNPIIRCSVGDVMDMIMQCLEALEFLHSNRIAHRDASVRNFLVQYLPRSLKDANTKRTDNNSERGGSSESHGVPMGSAVPDAAEPGIGISEKTGVPESSESPPDPLPGRPRVYLIDFELAVMFPDDTPAHEQVCVGPLYGGTILEGNIHAHRCSPEVLTGEPYNPYLLDIWQFGTSLRFFRSTIKEIDAMFERMRDVDPTKRPSAGEALKQLSGIVAGIVPRNLQIPPVELGDS